MNCPKECTYKEVTAPCVVVEAPKVKLKDIDIPLEVIYSEIDVFNDLNSDFGSFENKEQVESFLSRNKNEFIEIEVDYYITEEIKWVLMRGLDIVFVHAYRYKTEKESVVIVHC